MQQKIPQNCGIFVIYQKFQLKLDIFVVVDFHVFLAVDAHVFGVAEGDIVGAFRRGSVVDGLVVMFLIDAEIGLFGFFFGLGFIFAVDNGCDCVFVDDDKGFTFVGADVERNLFAVVVNRLNLADKATDCHNFVTDRQVAHQILIFFFSFPLGNDGHNDHKYE